MTEAKDVEIVPINPAAGSSGMMGKDRPMMGSNPSTNPDADRSWSATWPRVGRGEMPGEIDRYNMRRYLSLTANIEGSDLGSVIDQIDAVAGKRVGKPPKGVEVDLRGQVKPMRQMFLSLEIGLGRGGLGDLDHA